MWKSLRDITTVDLVNRKTERIENVLAVGTEEDMSNYAYDWNHAHGWGEVMDADDFDGYVFLYEYKGNEKEDYYCDINECLHLYDLCQKEKDFIVYEFQLYEDVDREYLVYVFDNYHVDILDPWGEDAVLSNLDRIDLTAVARYLAKRDGLFR